MSIDPRKAKAVLMKYEITGKDFIKDIQNYYKEINRQPDMREMTVVGSALMLCGGDRKATRELMRDEGTVKLLDAVDKSLSKYATPDNPAAAILELYLVYNLIRYAVMITVPYEGVSNATNK